MSRKAKAKKTVKPGIYRHWKGKRYLVIGVARHTECPFDLVIYKALYGNGELWARPLESFSSKAPGAIDEPRFQWISPEHPYSESALNPQAILSQEKPGAETELPPTG